MNPRVRPIGPGPYRQWSPSELDADVRGIVWAAVGLPDHPPGFAAPPPEDLVIEDLTLEEREAVLDAVRS